MAGRTFITSDLHFGHNKPFIYEARGFNSIEEHDAAIIENWNKRIDNEDTVFILGDLMLNDNEHGIECLNQLNGDKYMIRGNHDTPNRMMEYTGKEGANIYSYGYAAMLKYKKYNFYLSHYPTLTSNYDDDKPLSAKTINLCGHSHYTDPFADFDKGIIYHCELDAHYCCPVLLDDIIEEIKNKIYEQELEDVIYDNYNLW